MTEPVGPVHHHTKSAPSGHDHGPHGHQHPAPSGVAGLVACPVMPSNRVDPAWAEARGLFRDYEGTRYWFWCADCGPLFDADPGSYAKAR